MCNIACIDFGRAHLTEDVVSGKNVIEVGSLDVNGSLRAHVEGLRPASYLGVDVVSGRGVDELCDVGSLQHRYGRNSFDVVITTEVLEHVREWRSAISNLKAVLRPGGVLLLTTRSRGFPYHAYPHDFWRFEIDDMRTLFADFWIEALEPDPLSPGVFLKARKQDSAPLPKLDSVKLYSIVTGRRSRNVTGFQIGLRRLRRTIRLLLQRILPSSLQAELERIFPSS